MARHLHLEASPWDAPVSTRSKFGDLVWLLDITTPGQGPGSARVDWDFDLGDGLSFGQPRFSVLRGGLMRLVWSLFTDRRSGLDLTVGSVMKLSTAMRCLVRWMIKNDYVCISELTSAASEEYLDDVVSSYMLETELVEGDQAENESEDDEQDDPEIPLGALRPRTNFWSLLWAQRAVLREAGVAVLPEAPFGGKSARTVANTLATKIVGWIPPVPDEVALPVMAEAHRWLWERADDVIRLQDDYLALYRPELCSVYAGVVAGVALENFSFSCASPDLVPWRGPLEEAPRLSMLSGQWRMAVHDSHSVLRTLIEDVCAACVIVLQSEAGPRINEICGLIAGMNVQTGLPGCLELRSSKTGLNEHFFLKGMLSKMRRVPEEVEWLIGARPAGSNFIPAPVRAIQVLQRLFEPLRSNATDDSLRSKLIVQFTAPRGYPRDGNMIGRVLTSRLRTLQRVFIGNHVDLSGLPDRNAQGQDLARYRVTKGACLLTHSWRKSYALYVFRTDSRMIGAIAQQFHHLSLAMTEQGYLGNDPSLLEVMNGVRVQQTAQFFYEMARGERRITGRIAKLVDEFRAEFARILGTAQGMAGIAVMQRWVLNEDVRIWFSRHGKCFMGLAPSKARCHELGGTTHWANAEPNYVHRNPETCLGCPLYAVDAEHAEFWLLRYVENASFAAGSATGKAARAAKLRANQSEAVLQAIRVPLPALVTNDG
ncbi:MAG: hypothetical protein A3E01_14130 [Gammaproteobacteria bacterium RIFCSPHIGHO2_12_FULL_63_22]|nr:MAG: hypothetical protein A3E01_14130 [Gammaproteobacteria bacterium RIFCSPHIGHO2_12_FULL_63_22]